MKNKMKKLLSMILAITLCFSSLSVLSPLASAQGNVNYPIRGYNDSDYARNKEYATSNATIQEVINRLDGVLQGSDFASLLGLDYTLDKTVSNLISENLYNDKIITGIMKSIYPMICKTINDAIEENAIVDAKITTIDLRSKADDLVKSLVSKYGIYIYPRDLAPSIYAIDPVNFASVANWLYYADKNWDLVPWDLLTWNIHDMEGWIKGLGCVLSGFMPAIRALLQAVPYAHTETAMSFGTIDGDVTILAYPCYGYYFSIMPVLETLCGNFPVDYTYKGIRYTSIMDNATFCTLTDPVDIVAHIVYPIFTMVENTVAKKPLKCLMDLIPQLAYAVYNNLIPTWLNLLQSSVVFMVDINGKLIDKNVVNETININVWELLKDQLEGVNMTSLSSILNFALSKAEINMSLPEMDTNALANYGSLSTFPSGYGKVSADEPAVLLYLLRYLGSVCKDQSFLNGLGQLLNEEDGTLPEDVLLIFDNIGKNPDDVICSLVELCCPQRYDFSDLFKKNIPISKVIYSEYWNKADVQSFVSDLNGFTDSVVTLIAGKSVKELLNSALGDSIYTNKIINTIIIKLRDILVPLEKITNILHINISSWSNVDENTNWGFEDGDRAGFVNALIDAFSPFNNLLKLLFTKQDLYIMNNNLTVLGYDGYAYGVIPLLEAIGCSEKDIVAPDKYIEHINQDEASILRDILVPIINLADKILNEPISTVLNILPNILYFVETGSLQTALKNTLQSIFVLIDNVNPIYDLGLNIDLSFEGIIRLVSNVLGKEGNEGFISTLLNKLDVTEFLQGSVIKGTSKNGKTRYYIQSANEDTLTVLLRTVVNLIFTQKNEDAFLSLISKSLNSDTLVKTALSGVFEGLDNMYNEADGQDKILSLIYYIYTFGADAVTGDYSVVVDLLNRIDYILESLSSIENQYIVAFLETVADAVKKGTVNSNNTQSSDLEGFFTISTSLSVKNVTDATDFSDTLTPNDPETYPTSPAVTRQTEEDSKAYLFVDKNKSDISNINQSGMHIGARLNYFDANDLSLSLSLINPSDDITKVSDNVEVTTAKGKKISYSLSQSGSKINENNLPNTCVFALSGELPDCSDYTVIRIVLKATITGKDNQTYITYSYTDLYINTVDTKELNNIYSAYVAPENAYTDSYESYDSAYSQAQKVLKKNTSTQDEINEAESNLKLSFSDLEYNDEIKENVNNFYSLLPINKNNFQTAKSYSQKARNSFSKVKAILSLCEGDIIDKYYEAIGNYEAYANSLGADSYEKAETQYPRRNSYENDVTRTKLDKYSTSEVTFNELVSKLDRIIQGSDFKNLTGLTEPIGDMVYDKVLNTLCDNKTVTNAVKALYPTVCELLMNTADDMAKITLFDKEVNLSKLVKDLAKEVLSKYSIALFPEDLALVLQKTDKYTYATNIRILSNAGKDWDKVNFDLLDWHIYNLDTFIKALGDSLDGIYPLLKAVLSSVGYEHSDRVYSLLTVANLDLSLSATGCNGYDTVILPILEMLCSENVSYSYLGKSYNSIITPEDFDDLDSTDDIIAHTVLPLLSSLKKELNTNPISYILNLMPNICGVFEYDKLTNILNNLETVVGINVDVDVVGNVFNQNLELNVGSLLNEKLTVDISDLNSILSLVSESLGVELPEADTEYMFKLGSLEQKQSVGSRNTYGKVVADKGAVLAETLRYVFTLIGDDSLITAILDKIGVDLTGNETFEAIIKMLGDNGNDIVCALNEFAVPMGKYKGKNVYTGQHNVKKVTYSSYWTRDMAKDVSGNMDNFVNQITSLFGAKPLGTILEEKLSTGLYTNSNLAKVVVALRTALLGIDSTGKILDISRIDISSWLNVTEETTFGFKDGDKNGFINACAEMLRPFNEIFECLFANGDYSLLNYNIVIKGFDGYRQGIIPILQALGCNSEDIKSGSEYISDIYKNKDNAILDILNPIFNLLEKVYEAPVDTVLNIIPNLLYFAYTGNINNAVVNVLHSIYVVLDTVRPIFDVNLGIDIVDLLDNSLVSALNDFTVKYGIQIPPDFSLDAFLTGYVHSEDAIDSLETRTYLVEKNENTLTVLLRTLIDIAFDSNNPQGIKGYLYFQKGMTDELCQLVFAVIDGLDDIHSQNDGTDKILGILYKIYSIGDTYFERGSVSSTVLDNWKTVVNIFLSSEEEYIRSFILSIYGELCDYVKAETNSPVDVLPSEETVTFFVKVKLFFQKVLDFIKHLFVV